MSLSLLHGQKQNNASSAGRRSLLFATGILLAIARRTTTHSRPNGHLLA
jgi:hypothetical protein